MGVLGKDLLDIYRPYTHTKVQFGRDTYWVEHVSEPRPYGTVLVQVLNYDVVEYLHRLDELRGTLEENDRDSIEQRFRAVVDGFMALPFYRLYVESVGALEPDLFSAEDKSQIAERILYDRSFLNKYFQAGDDLRMIQDRYR